MHTFLVPAVRRFRAHLHNPPLIKQCHTSNRYSQLVTTTPTKDVEQGTRHQATKQDIHSVNLRGGTKILPNTSNPSTSSEHSLTFTQEVWGTHEYHLPEMMGT